jgi:DNA-binding MarR family transcriptional regulator
MTLRELHALGRRLQELATAALRATGRDGRLSAAELIIVDHVDHHGVSTINELSSSTGYAQSRVSVVVAGLRGRGIVRTSISDADRRCTQVEVAEPSSAAGPSLLDGLAELGSSNRIEVIAALDDLYRALIGDAAEYPEVGRSRSPTHMTGAAAPRGRHRPGAHRT